MGKAASIRARRGFYGPGGAAARTRPTTGHDPRTKAERRPQPARRRWNSMEALMRQFGLHPTHLTKES